MFCRLVAHCAGAVDVYSQVYSLYSAGWRGCPGVGAATALHSTPYSFHPPTKLPPGCSRLGSDNPADRPDLLTDRDCGGRYFTIITGELCGVYTQSNPVYGSITRPTPNTGNCRRHRALPPHSCRYLRYNPQAQAIL